MGGIVRDIQTVVAESKLNGEVPVRVRAQPAQVGEFKAVVRVAGLPRGGLRVNREPMKVHVRSGLVILCAILVAPVPRLVARIPAGVHAHVAVHVVAIYQRPGRGRGGQRIRLEAAECCLDVDAKARADPELVHGRFALFSRRQMRGGGEDDDGTDAFQGKGTHSYIVGCGFTVAAFQPHGSSVRPARAATWSWGGGAGPNPFGPVGGGRAPRGGGTP